MNEPIAALICDMLLILDISLVSRDTHVLCYRHKLLTMQVPPVRYTCVPWRTTGRRATSMTTAETQHIDT
jgi:hypothetical protein